MCSLCKKVKPSSLKIRTLGRFRAFLFSRVRCGLRWLNLVTAGSRSTRVDSGHVRILENLARAQAIPSPDDQHPLSIEGHGQGGMDQGLVVAMLVHGGKLKMAVQKQPQVIAPESQDDLLVCRLLAVDNAVGVEIALPAVQQRTGTCPKSRQYQPRSPTLHHEPPTGSGPDPRP